MEWWQISLITVIVIYLIGWVLMMTRVASAIGIHKGQPLHWKDYVKIFFCWWLIWWMEGKLKDD